ncbi:MAG TPA: NUDIX hydrolase [Pseudonocardiaceae bacterium]
MQVPVLVAAGAVVWQPSPSGDVEVALVHRPRYDDWSLPKGKPHAGESLPVTAFREVVEETGHTVALGPRLGSTRYRVPAGDKEAHYWAARPTGGSFVPNKEVDELRWLPTAAASDLISYEHDRTLLAGLNGAPAFTSTVLLVRHADAGERSEWSGGDDDQRPLTPAGRAQAEVLRHLLPLFGAQRVHSAPPLRCRQTVEDLATDLGTPVIAEPLLSDEGYLADPATALRRLIDVAAGPGGPAVVCSQGAVIAGLLSALAQQAGLPLREIPHPKSSYWGLFFSSGSPLILRAADYYDDALG